MKKHLIWLTILVPFVVGWIAYSFTVLQLNPLKWTQEARNSYMFICFLISAGIALFIPFIKAVNSYYDEELKKEIEKIYNKYYPRGK